MGEFQFWTISKLTRIAYDLRKDVRFYAPLVDVLDFMGIDPVTFTRAGTSTAVRRDGLTHNVAANVPRFEYNGEIPSGLKLSAGEVLQFSASNGLDNANTLIWFEDNVAKSTPTNTNPFNSSGAWAGNLNIHVKHICKLSRVLANSEIVAIQTVLDDIGQTIAEPAPPAPPGAVSGSFFQEVPAGARNGSNVTFTLSNDPEIDSLLLFYGGVAFERVASAPAEMEFTLSGGGNRTITMGLAPVSGTTFFVQYIVA